MQIRNGVHIDEASLSLREFLGELNYFFSQQEAFNNDMICRLKGLPANNQF